MTTTRRAPLAMALALALSSATITLAQRPGGGPGGGGPGGGRGGMFGGTGGPGGSITGLLQMPPIQEELKITEEQKAKITAINDASTKKRDAIRTSFGMNNNRGARGANQPGQPGQPAPGQITAGGQPAPVGQPAPGGQPGAPGGRRGQNAQANVGGQPGAGGQPDPAGQPAPGGQPGGRRGQNAQANAGGQPGGGFPGGGGGFGGGPGGFPGGGFGGFANMTDEERQAFQERMTAMRAATDGLQKDTEAAIAKVLDPKQRTRLAQIHLQRQGVQAFSTPELAKKLNINDEKFAEIQEILAGMGEARRAQFTKMREVFTQFASANNNGAPPDRNTMRTLFQNPEFQKKMDAQRKETDAQTKTLEDQTKLQIGKALTKKQKDTYVKLLGEPFDLAKLNTGRGGPGGRGPGGTPGAPGGPNAAPVAAADPVEATAKAAPAPAPAANPAQPARKSLRERRGGTSPNN